MDNRLGSTQQWGMRELRPIKTCFSFYPTDTAILAGRVAELKTAGVKVSPSRLVLVLIHNTEPAEMLALVVRTAVERALGKPATKSETVSGHPTFDLPPADRAKLDAVVAQLKRAKFTAESSDVVRSLVRAAPSGQALAPTVAKFLKDFPNKPRGLSKIRLERLAKANR